MDASSAWKGAWKSAKGAAKGVQQPMFMKAGGSPSGSQNFKSTLCRFFLEGTCTKGDGCTFSHGEEAGAATPTPRAALPCKFFEQGQCAKGHACSFSHQGAGGCAEPSFGGGKDWGGKGGGGGFKGGGGFGGFDGGGGFAAKGQGPVPCRFFAMGTCAKGWECTFDHGSGGGGKGKGMTFAGGGFGGGMKGGFGKGKSKNPNMGKGHLLPRTRISEAPFSGTVVEFKGKYGWIEVAEAIEHEKAEKHGGRLFFGKDDIAGADSVEAGATVEFHIWEDASGLGADEVTSY